MSYIIVFALGVYVGMFITCLCVAAKKGEEQMKIFVMGKKGDGKRYFERMLQEREKTKNEKTAGN